VLAIAPTYDEMEMRTDRARVRRDCAELTGGRLQRHHALRLNRILPHRHLARGRIDVGDPAEAVFAVRQHALDIDDRVVARIATHVRNQVPAVSSCASMHSAPSRPSRSMQPINASARLSRDA